MLSSLKSISCKPEDLKFKIPSGMFIGGPSQSGKSTLLKRIIDNAAEMFHPPPKRILYSFGEPDPSRIAEFEESGCEVMPYLADAEKLQNTPAPFVYIMDDCMKVVTEDYLIDLFTKKAHHGNFCVIFVTQHLFAKKSYVARINSHYLILMKAPGAKLTIRSIGSQIYPGQAEFFREAVEQATEKDGEERGYIVIDLHPTTPKDLMLRTNVFPGEHPTIFLDKKKTQVVRL